MSRTTGNKDFWLTALRAEGSAFLAAIGQEGALGHPVPSCPDWTVGDLARHLAAVYRRIGTYVRNGDAQTAWPGLTMPEDAPAADDPQVVVWFQNEFSQLDRRFDGLDADAPAWNWAPQSRTAAFWMRRMAHESAVHRWDAQTAVGLPEPIESKLAGDTVAEVLDTMVPAGRRRHTADVTGIVHLGATDLGQEWTLRLRGQGIALLDTNTLLDDDAHPARATASGTASDLALALWGRVAFDVLEIAGDASLLEALRVG
ncbi:MAG: maleylpyruvate isomerase family mycothiol-dependent enzyme [Betaproteobacteria bacterium]